MILRQYLQPTDDCASDEPAIDHTGSGRTGDETEAFGDVWRVNRNHRQGLRSPQCQLSSLILIGSRTLSAMLQLTEGEYRDLRVDGDATERASNRSTISLQQSDDGGGIEQERCHAQGSVSTSAARDARIKSSIPLSYG